MFQPPHIIIIHLQSSNTITRFPLCSPSFPPVPKLIIIFLFNKLARISIIYIELKIMSEEKEVPMIRVLFLKKKRKTMKVNPKLGGQWKVKKKVLCLVANGKWRKNHFHLFPLSPQNLHFFPLTLKFYFTMVIGCYLRIYSFFLGL